MKKIHHQLLVSNQRILEELMIYTVPTYIIDNEIIPEYYNTDRLLQIIDYKIANN
jgi:protein-disulfide isomerase